jgi:choline kinase
MKIVICAAGMGTRLGLNLPKCLANVDGQTLIRRQLNALPPVAIAVVAGYQCDLVAKELADFNVALVNNNSYATTSVVDSVRMGIGTYRGEVVVIDGDVLFETILPILELPGDVVCVKQNISDDNPVYATVENGLVRRFHRSPGEYEWAGICKVQSDYFLESAPYIYQILEKQLPLPHHVIDSVEIDTLSDLAAAEIWVKTKLKNSGNVARP